MTKGKKADIVDLLRLQDRVAAAMWRCQAAGLSEGTRDRRTLEAFTSGDLIGDVDRKRWRRLAHAAILEMMK